MADRQRSSGDNRNGKAKQRRCEITKLKPPVSAFTLAISLQVLLVFVNVVLLAVYLDDHREHRLVVSLGEPANVLSVSIKAVAQTIVIVSRPSHPHCCFV